MAAEGILIDSSVIIDFMRKKQKTKAILYRLFKDYNRIFISSLTCYELLCGAKSVVLKMDIEKLLSLFYIIDFGLNESVWAADIYKELKSKNQLIDSIDILISATALCHSLHLATLNLEHFSRIGELKLIH